MDARTRNVLLLLLTVPASSLLGLARAMMRMDGSIFASVWKANLWGDLAFVAGTVAAGAVLLKALPGWLRRWGMAGLGLSAVLALLLHWAVYALAWGFTVQSFSDHAAHPFLSFGYQWSAGDGNVAIFTWQWGWPGLAAMAFIGPALAHWATKQAGRDAAPAPAGPEGERQVG